MVLAASHGGAAPGTTTRGRTLGYAAYAGLVLVAAVFSVAFTLEVLMAIDGEVVGGEIVGDIELWGDAELGYQRMADVVFTTRAGKTHTVRMDVPAGHGVGDAVPVRYIPGLPESAGWLWLDDSPGPLALAIHGLLGPFLLFVILVPFGVRAARRRLAERRVAPPRSAM